MSAIHPYLPRPPLLNDDEADSHTATDAPAHDDKSQKNNTDAPAHDDKSQKKNTVAMHKGRPTRASFLGQVLFDGTEDDEVAQDKQTTRAMAMFSVLVSLFLKGNEIDQDELHRAFKNAVDTSLVLLVTPEVAHGMCECHYEDVYQILCDAANSKFQITIMDMIWEAEGVFHFLIRIKNMYFDGNLRAMAYTNKGKIVHVEAKKMNISKDCVVQNVRAFFGLFQGGEGTTSDRKRKLPKQFRELATALFDKFLVVENTSCEIGFDDFYRQIRLLYRNGLRILSCDVARHVQGIEFTLQAVYSPAMTAEKQPVRKRRFTLNLSSPFASPPNSPTSAPHGVTTLSAGTNHQKRRLRMVRVLAKTRAGRIVRCSSMGDADRHAFVELFFPRDSPASEGVAIPGQVAARNSARLSFVSTTEADMAQCVQPLPDQLRSRVLGEGTEIMPAFGTGRVVKVTVERPSAFGLPNILFGSMRLPLMAPNSNGVGLTAYAGGAYLTENRLDGKFVLYEGGASNKPIAMSRKLDHKTFGIEGRHPLFSRDKAVAVERRRLFYPWYRLESCDACGFKSYFISVWNGRTFHAVWKVHQRKCTNTDWLSRKQYKLVVRSLSGDATLAFITNNCITDKLHSSGWQVIVAPGVDPALMICIAACL